MSAFRLLGLSLALAAAACRPAAPPQLTDIQRAAVVDSVRGLLGDLATWMGSQGAGRAYATFYDSAPGFVLAADGRIVSHTYEAFASRYQGWAPPAGARMTWDTLRIEPLGLELAHFTAAFTEALTLPNGQAYAERGVMTGVAVRRAAGWKIAAVHTSVAPAASEGR